MGLGNPLPPSSDNEVSSDNEFSQQSISELVTILRSAFRSSVFDKVEEIMVARESKLLKKINGKDRKLALALMDKLQAEHDLSICRKNYEETKDALRVRDETCLDLQENLKKSDTLISELNLKNLTLEAAKTGAEDEVKALRSKVEDFSNRVVQLEKEFKEIQKFPHPGKQAKLEADEDTFSNLGTSKRLGDSIPAETKQDFRNFDPALTENNPSDSDRKGNSRLSVGAGSGRIVENAGVIIIVETDDDDDDECGPQVMSGAHERTPPKPVAENGGHPNSIKLESAKSKETASLKRKWVAGDSWRRPALLTSVLDSDSEVSFSSSSDSDDSMDNKEGKKLRMHLNLEANLPIFK